MNKLIINKVFTAALLVFLFTSCDQDQSIPDIARENTTSATIKEDEITVTEGNSPSFTIVQEDLIDPKFDYQEFFDTVSGQIGIRVIGGTAKEGEDFTFNIPTIQQVSSFLLQDGYYYGYDASVSLEHNVSNTITIINDSQTEGVETIKLQFFPVGLAGVIINDTLTISIND